MRLFYLAALLSAAFQAQAQWQLDNTASDLTFLTTKNSHVTETSHFKQLSGQFDGKRATLEVDLTSLDSLIPIRNERMLKFLFEAEQFPKAVITVDVDADTLKALQQTAQLRTELDAQISLHGQTKALKAKVLASVNSNGDISIVTTQPVLIQAADFLLADGIRQLQDIAKLQAISHTVPVSFALTYAKQK